MGGIIGGNPGDPGVPLNRTTTCTTCPTAALPAYASQYDVGVSGSLLAPTNAPEVELPNGAYAPSGDASCAPVAPENTFTAVVVPDPLPTMMSA